MNTDDLTDALRACAAGLYSLEAGTELLISNGTFLRRGFINLGLSVRDVRQSLVRGRPGLLYRPCL